jgi:hypothetical protein
MATSEQLEREAEATRARIAATLDELRGRMTAGQMVDQLVDYARDSGGGEFVRNLGNQVVGNPLPIALVGAGLAWLMMAGRRGPSHGAGGFGFGGDDVAERMSEAGGGTPGSGRGRRSFGLGGFGLGGFGTDDVAERMSEAGDGTAPEAGRARRSSARDAVDQTSAGVANLSEHAKRRAEEWARQTRGTAERLNRRAGEAGAELQDRMSEAGATVRDAASSAYDTASETYDAAAERARQGADAMRRNARMIGDNLASSGQNLLGFLQQQPLVLAGLGLAIGGLLGAAVPSSEMEDELMGDASDAAKSQAKSFAQEQVDAGKQAAADAWNAAKPELEEQVDRATSAARGAADEAAKETTTGFGGEATLVPSDQTAKGETAGDGARRDTEQSSR